MALKATVYKVDLQISDMDRHYYQNHHLTLAQHPSETLERMMLRILVFALHAQEKLMFTRGLSSDNEPDIWLIQPNDDIELWIDLGQPDEKRIRKACARANNVYIYTYNERSANIWWQQINTKLTRFENLHIYTISDDIMNSLTQLVQRSMLLQCAIQDAEAWFGDAKNNIHIKPVQLR